MERENRTLGSVLERMSPGTEADFLVRFATRVLGEVSIDDLPPVMQVHDLIAHYQVRCFSKYFFLFKSKWMFKNPNLNSST